jgi:predicted outer membrane protein
MEDTMPQANPTQVQKYLKGVNYPARKAKLIENAKSMGADDDVCASLKQLLDMNFETSEEVSQAIGTLSGMQGGLGGQAEFLAQAMQDSLAEVELCELALQKTSNDDIKQFAQHMLEDHSYMESDIEHLAAKKRIALPKDLTEENMSALEKMKKLSGREFDLEFMNHNVQDHEKDVKVFRHYAEQGEDSELMEMAKNAAGVLGQHLKMAQEIAGKLRS